MIRVAKNQLVPLTSPWASQWNLSVLRCGLCVFFPLTGMLRNLLFGVLGWLLRDEFLTPLRYYK